MNGAVVATGSLNLIRAACAEVDRNEPAAELAPGVYTLKVLEQMRIIRDVADTAVRQLVCDGGGLGLSKTSLAHASGANIGSVTRWQNNPLPVGPDGLVSASSVPRPGRVSRGAQ